MTWSIWTQQQKEEEKIRQQGLKCSQQQPVSSSIHRHPSTDTHSHVNGIDIDRQHDNNGQQHNIATQALQIQEISGDQREWKLSVQIERVSQVARVSHHHHHHSLQPTMATTIVYLCWMTRTPIACFPSLNGKPIDLHSLYLKVTASGGWEKVCRHHHHH